MTLADRWPLPDAADLRDRLLEAYADPARGYHDLRHLGEVLGRLEELAGAGTAFDRLPVVLAAWFHDAVYAGAPDDEERSARWAEEALPGPVPDEVVGEVARLVRMTAEHRPRRRGPQRVRAVRRRPGHPGRAGGALRGVRRGGAPRARPRPRRGVPCGTGTGPAGARGEAAPVPHLARPDRLGGAGARQPAGRARAAQSGWSGLARLCRRSPAARRRATSSREDTGCAPAATTASYHSSGTS